MRILKTPSIDFLGKRWIALGVSTLLIGVGMGALILQGGPKLGIDFAGGSQIVVHFSAPPDLNQLRDALGDAGLDGATIQEFRSTAFEAESEEVIIRAPGLEDGAELDALVTSVNELLQGLMGSSAEGVDLNTAARGDLMAMLTFANPLGFDLVADPESADAVYQAALNDLFNAKSELGLFRDWTELDAIGLDPAVLAVLRDQGHLGDYAIVGSDFVGAQVGQDLRNQTIQAIVWALIGMLAYITYRFEFKFGVAAVVALAHDVLIVLGAFVLTGREFNLPVVAAFLTIVGYSLNDTVVVFDRVRENTTALRRMNLYDRINTSLNQTLSRTLLTSVTTLIVVTGLFLFGGPVINDFAFALLIGVMVGTYSSLFVASPTVWAWQQREIDKRH